MIDLDILGIIYIGRIGKRKCYRVYHSELFLEIELDKDKTKKFNIKDFSTFGVAFYPEKYKDSFFLGKKICLSIIFKGSYLIKNIKGEIIRIYKKTKYNKQTDIVCCKFIEITRRQEYLMDRLCTSIQKELISFAKKEKTDGWKL